VPNAKNPASNKYFNTIDPEEEWWQATVHFRGKLGYVFRLRGLAAIAFANLSAISGMIVIYVDFKVLVAFSVPSIIVIALILYIRVLLISACKTDEALHSLLHHVRERFEEIRAAQKPADKAKMVTEFHRDSCQRIATYFQHRSGDTNIQCCVRVMEQNAEGRKLFHTRGRSNGLATERGQTSEPICVEKGIVKAFLDKDCQGAFRIDDINRAEVDGVWVTTGNDRKFDDIRYILVCPINGFVDGNKNLLGLLYLTSRTEPIQEVFWTAQKAIADGLGLVYPLIYTDAVAAN
jgi:hypothetical protein